MLALGPRHQRVRMRLNARPSPKCNIASLSAVSLPPIMIQVFRIPCRKCHGPERFTFSDRRPIAGYRPSICFLVSILRTHTGSGHESTNTRRSNWFNYRRQCVCCGADLSLRSVVTSFARSHARHSNVRCIMSGTKDVRRTSVIGLPH